MVYSMTAFAKQEVEYTWGKISWEIRSLNQRYLDIHVDVPKDLNDLSWVIRKKIQYSLARGKIECILQLNIDNNSVNVPNVNKKLVRYLIESANWIKTQINEGEINPLDILSWPGVITYTQNNLSHVRAELLICFEKTLHNLIQDREREGVFLKKCIINRLQYIYEKIDKISQYLPNVLKLKRKKLLEQTQDVCIHIDTIRLEQELLIVAQKIDVSEEIDRLLIHTKEIHNILSQTGPVGRRLDFLIQELHREANTLTSKSINAHMTQLAIALKIFIEQIREQAQNIE